MSLECPRSRPRKAHPTSSTAKRRPAINSAAPSSQRKAAPKDSTIASMAKGPIYKRPNLHRRSSHSRSGGERRTELSSRCQAAQWGHHKGIPDCDRRGHAGRAWGPDGVDAPDGNNLPEWWCCKSLQEASMNPVSTVGLDLAKYVFQLHGADSAGAVVFRKRLRRGQLLAFLATLPPCTVAMEACGSAHYWGREIAKLGHTVRLIAPAYVKPFVKRQKNDMADAEAICEAAQRPTMRFAALKSANQQAAAVVFRTRDLLVRQRTQAINALRGHLTEF